MNILLINNTSSEYHIGCYGVSSSIIDSINSIYQGCNIISIYTLDIKENEQQRLNLAVSKKSWDRVIVNGEGSLHLKNVEGDKIFKLISLLMKKVSPKKISIINASIYEAKNEWIKTLKAVGNIEVRDMASQNFLSKHGVGSVFKLDRLFHFLSSNYSNSEIENSTGVNDGYVIFDAVNKNHSDIIKALKGLNKTFYYGTVDLSPFYKILSSNDAIVRILKVKNIFKFYLKILNRLYKYNRLQGKKYINNIEDDLLSLLISGKDIITARYHIVVICLFLGKDFYYFSSNTNKIKYLIEVFQNEFPGQVQLEKQSNSLIKVRLQYSRYDMIKFMKRMNYEL